MAQQKEKRTRFDILRSQRLRWKEKNWHDDGAEICPKKKKKEAKEVRKGNKRACNAQVFRPHPLSLSPFSALESSLLLNPHND